MKWYLIPIFINVILRDILLKLLINLKRLLMSNVIAWQPSMMITSTPPMSIESDHKHYRRFLEYISFFVDKLFESAITKFNFSSFTKKEKEENQYKLHCSLSTSRYYHLNRITWQPNMTIMDTLFKFYHFERNMMNTWNRFHFSLHLRNHFKYKMSFTKSSGEPYDKH